MRWVTISILITLLSVAGSQAQTPPKPPTPAQTPPPAKTPAPAQTPAPAPAKPPAAAAAPAPNAAAQPAKPSTPALNATELGQEWLDRLNQLDDWHISMDGKEEGIDQLVDHFMERFTPDVLAEVPPYDEEQLGPVMLIGTQQVREWVKLFASTHVNLKYYLKRQTEEKIEGEQMVYSKQLPWGGLGVAYPIIAYYANRQDRERFTEVGAVFIQYREDGKIQRFRLMQSEKDQVEGGRGQ